jgi:hypothetical protein
LYTKNQHTHLEKFHSTNTFRLLGISKAKNTFSEHRKQIHELFELAKVNRIDRVSIHVRRGDYVKFHTSFPPIHRRYLQPAIKFFTDRGYKKFLVFSDDIEWCVEHFKSYDGDFLYSGGQNEFQDLSLMANCTHNIIANSSFSWWGAWLNQNPNKIVISPHPQAGNWFGQRVKLDTTDLVPDSWYKIKF